MQTVYRTPEQAEADPTLCKFCGLTYAEHNDPPTQQMSLDHCLGSRCNFQPREPRVVSALCPRCVSYLGKVGPVDGVRLPHTDCQAKLTQGLRIIATHREFSLSIQEQPL